MDERLKILLGSEDIIARNNEDLYININLNRSFFEYKREKYDNDFDLAKQFDKERNLSRNFRIYGIVDSNVINTNNIPIKVYSDSGATNLVLQTSTSSMNFNSSINVFNKARGKYLIELNNYSGSSIFIKTPTNNNNIAEQIFEQQLVFYDFDGEFIPYGTETIEVNDNFETIEISNNFPFFYNKHWIKNNINLQDTKYPVINFSGSNETMSEGETKSIIIYLDKPSPFGNEMFDFVFDSGSADVSDFTVYSGNTSNILSGTTQLVFSQGEQSKSLSIRAEIDSTVELIEDFNFNLDNFIKVKSGTSLYYNVEITNSTERKYAIYEVTNLFENRAPFLGRTASTFSTQTYPIPAIFRNGVHYNGLQNEFYPIDEVVLQIQNTSTSNSLLPVGSGLGNIEDVLWTPGETKIFTIQPEYSTSVTNEVSIYLPPALNTAFTNNALNQLSEIQSSANYVIESISINGFEMEYIEGVTYPFISTIPNGQSSSYEALKKLLGNTTGNIYSAKNLFQPFTITTDDSNYLINLKAKSPGVRLDVKTNVKILTATTNIATATTVTDYSYPTQLPFRFTLLGNENNGDFANYKVSFSKLGYNTAQITSTALASTTGQENYLVMCLSNILHNWDSPNNRPIAFSGDPVQGSFLPNNYFLPKGKVYYQGAALLSAGIQNISNLTNYGSATDPVGYWQQTPLNVIEKTNSLLSVETSAQVGLMKINTTASPVTPVSTTANTNFYSFDYRNDNTGIYTTFYWSSLNSANLITNVGGGLRLSATTILPRISPGLKYELDLGTTYQGQTIPVGPLEVDYPGYNSQYVASTNFYSPYRSTLVSNNNISYQPNGTTDLLLTAKSPGTPFEIKNIVNNNPNSQLAYMLIAYNEIQGVTPNPYNNKMGGFSIIA